MDRTASKHRLDVTTPSDREIVMTRAFDAPRPLVYDAFTKPELIAKWLLGPDGWSMPVCEVDLRAGGSFRYGWRSDSDGCEFALNGNFLEVAPDRIVHAERFEGAMNMGDATITTTFEEAGGATTVTMTCLYPSREARNMALESGMDEGVARSYERLDGILRVG